MSNRNCTFGKLTLKLSREKSLDNLTDLVNLNYNVIIHDVYFLYFFCNFSSTPVFFRRKYSFLKRGQVV